MRGRSNGFDDGTASGTRTRDREVSVELSETAGGPVDSTALIEPSRPSKRWWLVAGVLVAAGSVAAWVLLSGESVSPAASAPQTQRFEEVILADLIEEQSYDGTLGTTAADPIRSQLAGTVTSAVDPGSIVGEGDILFSVDGAPVLLLEGAIPAYRDLGSPDLPTMSAVSNGMTGTVTRVAEAGVFEQGDTLYWVDEQPVVLLYGDLPQYRTIGVPRQGDTSGPDVVQLKEALQSLGYDPDGAVGAGETFGGNAENMVERWQEDIGGTVDGSVGMGEIIYSTGPIEVTEFLIAPGDSIGLGQDVADTPDVDEEIELVAGDDVLQLEAALDRLGFSDSGRLAVDGIWDAATEAAVTVWQESAGAEADGVVDLGEVVFLPGVVRVLGHLATPGSIVNPGSAVLDISSAAKLVIMNLPAADQGALSVGDRVTVKLPDGTEAPASVVEVASVATVGNNNSTVFEVTISLDDASVAAGLDEAPVDVLVVTDSALGVLAVPVTSLLVLAEGGYAVEVDNGAGETRFVAVEPGFFADGLVEVRTNGLSAGDRVVVP